MNKRDVLNYRFAVSCLLDYLLLMMEEGDYDEDKLYTRIKVIEKFEEIAFKETKLN